METKKAKTANPFEDPHLQLRAEQTEIEVTVEVVEECATSLEALMKRHENAAEDSRQHKVRCEPVVRRDVECMLIIRTG